ncbi:nitroreductase family protein [Bdellovibrionota bacterium FG-2]
MKNRTNTDIFSEVPKLDYEEPAPEVSSAEFKKVVLSRRSVRVYTKDSVPENVMRECLELGLLSPNSSNLQPWEFYWVRSPEKKKLIVEACLSQPAAATAQELVVCVARTKTWKQNAKLMIQAFDQAQAQGQTIPESVRSYYGKLVPLAYSQGYLGLWGALKSLIVKIRGLTKATPREPTSLSEMKIWASKTTALAAQTLMLAFRAYGFDTCPMEGLDSTYVKKALGLSKDAMVVMVLSVGKRAPNGIYGPRVRFESARFIKEV